jgi:hypothetical protein
LIVDFHSLVSLPIELWQGKTFLSHATGFFHKKGSRLYLVSNWHVFSGRDALSGQPLHSQGGLPDRLKILLRVAEFNKSIELTLHINQDECSGWLHHPEGQKIDVACARIYQIPECAIIRSPTENCWNEDMHKGVGSECYVVGYPLERKLTDNLPVWKRASLATDFDVDYASSPCFLIDTTARPGMSGSPVYLRSAGATLLENGDSVFLNGSATNFIGVYSGRVQSCKDGDLSLGKVWRSKVINEIIQNRLPGGIFSLNKSG